LISFLLQNGIIAIHGNSNALFAKEIQSFLINSSVKIGDKNYKIMIGAKGGKWSKDEDFINW